MRRDSAIGRSPRAWASARRRCRATSNARSERGSVGRCPTSCTRLRSRRGYSRERRKNSDQVGQSPTGSRCTASANAASTSRCSCCISNTRRCIPKALNYTQFCVHYRRWRARQDVVMRLEYAAGERMFVDFAGDTVAVTDPETGEIWNAQIFVSVLGASGYLYVEATRSQDLASWLGAHVRALEFYGGSVRAVVPDYVPRHIIQLVWPTGLC